MSATGRGATRNERDFYETPAWCTEAICRELVFGDETSILEPCCGRRAIVDVMERELQHIAAGFMAFDINTGIDFLTWESPRRFDFVITNPPYTFAREFVDKALEVSNCVVMLLRINFLGAQKRREWWRKNPPTALFVLSDRPKFGLNKHGKLSADATEYAWFVWDKTGRQQTGIHWL